MNWIIRKILQRRIQLTITKFARAHVTREDALIELHQLTGIRWEHDHEGRKALEHAVNCELERTITSFKEPA